MMVCWGLSGVLWFIAGWYLGWQVAGALCIALLVHESGHLLAWRVYGVRSHVVVMPYFAFCLPVQLEEAQSLPPFQKGVVCLAGCGASLVFATGVGLVTLHLGNVGERQFIFLLWFIPLMMNGLNLAILMPVLDGGKCLALVTSGHGKLHNSVLAGMGLIQGVAVFGLVDVTGCLICGILSLLAFPFLLQQTTTDAVEIRVVERLLLFAAWAAILACSALLLLSDSIVRLCAVDLAWDVAVRIRSFLPH